jgi:FKBP-type peptidyl-prolyl cis-trans isomerase SlyD
LAGIDSPDLGSENAAVNNNQSKREFHMRIAKDCLVAIQYTLTNESGHVLDSSPQGEPLEYLHGAAGILPELERHLAGKDVGDAFDITITPDRGFGERRADLVEIIPRADLSESPQVSVGDAVTRTTPDGAIQDYLITVMDADSITIDANHPLSGMTLRFQGAVVSVRAATAEELGSI